MTGMAKIRFERELKGLLTKPWPSGLVTYPVARRASLKDVIEALGVPHTEVYGLRVGEEPVGFDALLKIGSVVTVSPARFPIDPTRPSRLRPTMARLAFVCDANVGRLARLLRLLGFDCAFSRDIADADLAERAEQEGRVVLSRDRACLKRSRIVHGRLVRANDPLTQVRGILTAYGLWTRLRPFSRCLACNAVLVPVDKASILERLEPKTKRYYEEFWHCPDCRRLFWAGSHHDGMLRLIEKLGRETADAPVPRS